MASNGLIHRAKRGKCRICQRSRKTDEQMKAVGEVRRGYATGHIWECIDAVECTKVANEKIKDCRVSTLIRSRIEKALTVGSFTKYVIVT